ncbi:hypothetical protein AVO41_00575 [Thiomicrospira sp. WB1]|nr:hypothetical protein AVO41_00575 [Thiomicrospira sp. WB1]
MIGKALIIWLGLLGIAILNGALREGVWAPMLGEVAANLISGLMLAGLILGVAYYSLPWLAVTSFAHYGWIGALWGLLTGLFEGAMIHWQGRIEEDAWAAMTFEQGNLWPLIWLVTCLAPVLAALGRRRFG